MDQFVSTVTSSSSMNSKDPLCYECNNRDYGEDWRCMDRNCLIKQVVEKCTNEINTSSRWSESRAFADEVLQLFEIMEVE